MFSTGPPQSGVFVMLNSVLYLLYKQRDEVEYGVCKPVDIVSAFDKGYAFSCGILFYLIIVHLII